jgi:pilus assembly protein CpaF
MNGMNGIMERNMIFKTTLGHFLEPIGDLFNDASVTEIMINGTESIFFERAGRLELSPLQFPSKSWLDAVAQNIAEYVNRPLDEDHPTLDARLPDGRRVHVVRAPASRTGTCITIRRFQYDQLGIADLVERQMITAEVQEFLKLAVAARRNMVFAGACSSGKTTLLNAVAGLIPAEERIIVLEDTSELHLPQTHVVYLEAQTAPVEGREPLTIRELFANCLRMRPDRILIGEVRRGEALDLIQAMISGHAGSLTTVHASTAQDAASRLETMCLLSDTSMPVYVARAQVASALHLVVQTERFPDGRRLVTSISECRGLDDRQCYQWVELYRYEVNGGSEANPDSAALTWTGRQPQFASFVRTRGLTGQVQLTRALFTPRKESMETKFGSTDSSESTSRRANAAAAKEEIT